MRTILVTGADGQLGNEFRILSPVFKNFEFIFHDIATLDITKSEQVNLFFQKNKIDCCINCAAYTAVDKAESEQQVVYEINASAVKNLALGCQQRNSLFIQISTDFVFDGSKSVPYTEEDVPNPQGVYASTKLSGEKMAISFNQKTLVIRTAWIYSTFGNNFVKSMQRLGKEQNSLRVIFDQVGTPTYARDLANAIMEIITKWNEKSKTGIYHFSNEGVASWYDFAMAIMEFSHLKCKVNPIFTKDYPTPAVRPKFSVLSKKKIKENFGLHIPYWRDSLKDCIALQKNELIFPR